MVKGNGNRQLGDYIRSRRLSMGMSLAELLTHQTSALPTGMGFITLLGRQSGDGAIKPSYWLK